MHCRDFLSQGECLADLPIQTHKTRPDGDTARAEKSHLPSKSVAKPYGYESLTKRRFSFAGETFTPFVTLQVW